MYARRTSKAVFRGKLNVKTLVDYKNDCRTCYILIEEPVARFQSYPFSYIRQMGMFINS